MNSQNTTTNQTHIEGGPYYLVNTLCTLNVHSLCSMQFICLSSLTVFVRRSIKANDRSQPIYALVQVMNTSCADAFMLKPKMRNINKCAIWCETTIQGLKSGKGWIIQNIFQDTGWFFNWPHSTKTKKSHESIRGPFRWRISWKSSSGWLFGIF